MKTESEVQDRIRYLLDQEFERRATEAEEKLPCRCVHNYRHTLDSRKSVEGEPNDAYNRIVRNGLPVVQTIGLCMQGAENPEEWNGTICEDPIDAQRCPLFTAKESREEIRSTLEGQIRDIVWVRDNLPEVHALLWALGSEKLPDSEPPPPTPKLDDSPVTARSSSMIPVASPAGYSWLQRLLLRWFWP